MEFLPLYLSLSLSISFFLSLSLSVSLSLYLSINISPSLFSISFSLSLSLSLPFYFSFFLSSPLSLARLTFLCLLPPHLLCLCVKVAGAERCRMEDKILLARESPCRVTLLQRKLDRLGLQKFRLCAKYLHQMELLSSTHLPTILLLTASQRFLGVRKLSI